MENRLKKQLALIKSRAMAMARRSGRSPVEPDRADATATARPSPVSHPIVDDLLRAGAVARASDLPANPAHPPPRRGPWWWRRRLKSASGAFDPVERARRASDFESEFQRLCAGLNAGAPLDFEAAVPGEVRSLEGASYYLVTASGLQVDSDGPTEAARFAALDAWPESVSRGMVGRFVRRGYDARGYAATEPPGVLAFMRRTDPRGLLFLDIETAGLSANTYVFLCGLMHLSPESGEFRVEQVFARDYAEEEGLLLHVRDALTRFDTVVTYNGASFDVPFLRTRMAVHRIPDIVPMGSVDLLHAARRVFRPALPNVRLITVEEHLRGVARVDDIPSRFIPRAYHEYVHTRDARIMRNVVYHNRMDLFTMAVILNRLALPAGRPAHEEAEKPFAPASFGDTIASPNPPHASF